MHIHGHGSQNSWNLEKRQSFKADHIAKLTNKNAYVALTTVSCFTGHYDGSKEPTITESMLRCPDAGAILIVAPSRAGVPIFHSPDDMRLMMTEGKMDATTETMTNFWLFALRDGLTAGQAIQKAKAEMIDDAATSAGHHFIQCELNLLGDPTLDLRPGKVFTPKVKAPASIAMGVTEILVETDKSNLTVCLWKEQEVYAVATTDDAGQATLNVQPRTTGEMRLTVSGLNANVVQKNITVK